VDAFIYGHPYKNISISAKFNRSGNEHCDISFSKMKAVDVVAHFGKILWGISSTKLPTVAM
jgi:hypothetical protein